MKAKYLQFLLFVLGYGMLPAQNDTILKLFNVVQINNRKMMLGQKITDLADITIKNSETQYSLKKGSYNIADSITLEVDSDNKIIAFRFFYDYEPQYSNDTAYIHEQHKYQKLLQSQGREYHYSSATISIQATKWESEGILFELIEITSNGKKSAYSVIFDKQAYLKTIPNGEQKNGETSIELLNLIGVN